MFCCDSESDRIMKLKEKTKNESSAAAVREDAKRLSGTTEFLLSALLGFLAAGTGLGGGAPLCAAAAAVSAPLNGFAALSGALVKMLVGGTLGESVTEIIAMPAIIISKVAFSSFFGKKLSPAASGIFAGAAYFVCGAVAAISYRAGAALIFALAFRGIIAGAAAFFASKTLSAAKSGLVLSADNRAAAAVSYALAICMLCGVSFGSLNAGRAVGAFFAVAAAYRLGSALGGASAALAAFAAGAASYALLPSSPIVVCAGLAAGIPRKKGRFHCAAVFLAAGLAGALVYGMPNDALKLLCDMTCAAAAFCLLPDKLYRKTSVKAPSANSAAFALEGGRLKFAAAAVSDIRESFEKAAEVLDRNERERNLSEEVSGRVCSLCRSSAFCGGISERFRSAESVLYERGFISERELPAALDSCPHKDALTKSLNETFRRDLLEKRFGETAEHMREVTAEQLLGTEKMLEFLSLSSKIFPVCDETLSEYVREIFTEAGAENPAAAVFGDTDGRLYIECFYEGELTVSTDELAERLSAAVDRELDSPEKNPLGGITRICFHEPAVFAAETAQASVSGREGTSGDFGAVFRDGFGSICVLLSDGMGSGARAAVESCMTVSLMTRIIRAGLGAETAVRLINLLLLTKSADESFSTIDLMTINLFTGKAEILKLGAAQTFIKTGGTVKTIESRSTPVGIIGSVEISRFAARLSDGDEAVMITDGICEEVFPQIRELMLGTGITARDCAERIIACAEREKESDPYRQDDKTAYVVKIHKI